MSKAVLISIRPEWCEKIINGQKTIELRKTRPKMDTPFKCYIYCTAGRPDLNIPISNERLMRDYLETGSMKSMTCQLGNGKVIGEFTCNRVTNLFQTAYFGWTMMIFYTRVCLLRKCENTQTAQMDCTAGTFPISRFTIPRANCGNFTLGQMR